MRLVPVKKQMKDQRVVGWVVTQLNTARYVDNCQRERELLPLLDEETGLRWIFSGNKVLGQRVIEEMADDVVVSTLEGIEKRWWKMLKPIAARVLVRLAQASPARALYVIDELELVERTTGECEQLWSLLAASEHLGPAGARMVARLVERYQHKNAIKLYMSGLVKAAVFHRLDSAPGLLAKALSPGGCHSTDVDILLDDAYSALAPELPFFRMLLDREGIFGWYKFGDLPELFADDADIATLDRFADDIDSADLPRLLSGMSAEGPHLALAEFAHQVAAALGEECPPPTLKRFKLFVLAVTAARLSRTTFTFGNKSFKWLMNLLTCDIEVMPFEKELIDTIVAKAAGNKTTVLVEEMALARQYRGASRLMKVVSRLLDPSFIHPLIDAMSDDSDELGGYDAGRVLALYGDDAVAALGERWADLDFVQQIHCAEALSIIASPAVVKLLTEIYPDMRKRSSDFELWCSMAEACAAPELIQLLKNPPRGSKKEARRAAGVIQAVSC